MSFISQNQYGILSDVPESGEVLISTGFNGSNLDPAIPFALNDEVHVRQQKKINKSTYITIPVTDGLHIILLPFVPVLSYTT
jgi:hypothetical protein